MTAERDTTRIVRSWLRTDEHESADRVLEMVLSRLDTTPQRRPMWPSRRSNDMNGLARIAMAAAAVVAIAVVGYNLLPGTSGPGGQGTAPPSSSPVPSSTPVPLPPNGALQPGTYRLTSYTSRPLTLTVPSGWAHADGNFIQKGDPWGGNGVALALWQLSHVYTDSCQWTGTLAPVDSTASIVDGLVGQTGHAKWQATATTIAGRPATRLELSLESTFDVAGCDKGIVRLWPDPGPREQYGLPIYPGQTTTVYVVDPGDGPTLVIGIRNDDSPAADATELEAVLGSVAFER